MKLSLEDAQTLARSAFESVGIPPEQADISAAALVRAEADGMASHGLSRVGQYCGHVQVGRVNPSAIPTVRHERPAAVVIDAQEALAFPALQLASRRAAEKAKTAGIGMAAVGNSHHFGVAGHIAEDLARQGLIAIVMGNSPAAMPMWGGSRPLFGTNPIAAAFPRTGQDPVVIDLSLSAVARGKLMVAAQKGESIPEGWALDADGQPTTDPKAGLAGMMVPAGGAKGAMLALMIEVLVVGLTGSSFGYEADSFFELEGNRPRIAQLVIAIDPQIAGQGVFQSRLEDLITVMSQDQSVRLPGSRRFALRHKAETEGIEVNEAVLTSIQKFLKEKEA
ncbi:MAG: Ldh family oxidoreductase [Burkholderiaceae bacterium]